MKFENLIGERIDLVDLLEVGEKGLEDMYEYSREPSFYRYMEYEHHMSMNETRAYMHKLFERSRAETWHYWFIRLKESWKIIGTLGLLNIDLRKGSCEIGYGISPHYWRKGLFSESLTLVLSYLFQKLNFCRVSAITEFENLPSIKALEKHGFKKEGVMREYYLSSKDGKRYDAVMLGLLRREFINPKRNSL